MSYSNLLKERSQNEIPGTSHGFFLVSLARRAVETARVAEGRLAILGVWRRPARLLIVRSGNPLAFGQTRGRLYFASLPEGLPGKVAAITDQYAGVLTFDGRRLHHEAHTIGR